MAERRTNNTTRASAGAADAPELTAGEADAPELTAGEAGRIGLQQITELTGKAPEGITGVEPAEDGWVISVEVVEDRRVPSSTDVLATYEIEIGMAGDLVSYRRVQRYSRGHGNTRGIS